MAVIIPELLDTLQVAMPSLASISTTAAFAAERASARERLLRRNPQVDDAGWHERLASVLVYRGELQTALWHASRGVELAAQFGEEQNLGDSLLTLTLVNLHLGRNEAAGSTLGQLDGVGYKRTPRSHGRYAEARGAYLLHTADLRSGGFFEAESQYRAAIRAYEALNDLDGQLRSLVGLTYALSALGLYPASIDEADRGLRICADNLAWRHVPALLLIRALCIRDTGIHEPTHVLFEEAIDWAEALEDTPILAHASLGYAMVLGYGVSPINRRGLPAAEREFARSLELAAKLGGQPLIVRIHTFHAVLYEKLGMVEEASELRAKIASLERSEEDQRNRDTADAADRKRRDLESWRHERFQIRMRETIDSTPDALLVLDAVRGSTGRIIELINEVRNTAAHDLCGCVATDVLTLTQLEALPAFVGLRERIVAAIENRKMFKDEIWIEGDPGKCIARRLVPVGEGVAITFRDATLEREAACALTEAAQRAREADRAKSEFLANMSHEVRTPINGVLGLARLLCDTELDETQRSYVNGIVSSADILLAVIGDVLDLSKIEAGRVELEPQPTELTAVVNRVLGLFHGQSKSKRLAVSTEIASDLPRFLLVDGSRLQQVLANLVGNAVKFTKSGSIQVTVSPCDSGVRFEVLDTGPGIAQNGLESAFEAFHQATREARLQGGTGLGLTISRSIVELMGGRIGVESELGRGSCFWFELPLVAADAPAPAAPCATGSSTEFSDIRVLLVEDNPVNIMVAKGTLLKLGCKVDVASDGATAVQMAVEGDYAAVLMDVRMPVMDGLEATRQIREGQTGRRTPIIALTASALTDDRDECYEAGMDDYLGKPFTAQGLSDMLARWVWRAEG